MAKLKNDEFISDSAFILTVDQENLIVNRWHDKEKSPPSLKELFGLLWPSEEYIASSLRTKAIKKFLTTSAAIRSKIVKAEELPKPPPIEESQSNQILIKEIPKTSNVLDEADPESDLGDVQLTDSQKIYISENRSLGEAKLTSTLFGALSTHPHVKKLVREYIRTLPMDLYGRGSGKNAVLAYNPPKTISEAAELVNRAVFQAINLTKLQKDMQTQEKLSSLIKFLHTFRFALTYEESCQNDVEKALFETSFVKYVWDKPDLSEEEIDLYINLCLDTVSLRRIEQDESFMKDLRTSNSDNSKISMSIVESLANLRQEKEDISSRQFKLINNLQGKRADRIDSFNKANASVLQLVAAWRDAEKRERLIKLGNERKALVKSEIEKIDSMELFKAEMWGVNPESFDFSPSSDHVVEEAK